jgi:hypothetical protein
LTTKKNSCRKKISAEPENENRGRFSKSSTRGRLPRTELWHLPVDPFAACAAESGLNGAGIRPFWVFAEFRIRFTAFFAADNPRVQPLKSFFFFRNLFGPAISRKTDNNGKLKNKNKNVVERK